MVKAGALVRRVHDEMLAHIRASVLSHNYPPENSICVVVSNPKEIDVSSQRRSWGGDGFVSLAKAVDVMCNNKIYEGCELRAFEKV